MEIKEMSMSDIEARSLEIEEEIKGGADVDALTEEISALEERKVQIEKEAEERKALLEEVEMTATEVKEERKEIETMEFRDSKQYIDAYANYIKTGDDREARTLMTQNNEQGTLPVPTFVADILAGEFNRDIISGFRKMYAKGNVRVPVEISAPAAAMHLEGDGAVEEEQLVIKNIMLLPLTFKKWVGITDEALDLELLDSRSYLEYIFEEIARGIAKAREEAFFGNVQADTNTLTAKVTSATAAITDFINARAALNADARDLVAIVDKTAYAAYMALQLSASYPIDIFDGMKVIVRDLSDYGMRAIVGDLRGYMENLPLGETVQFKKDDTTLMTSDVVRVLGRMPASVGIVGNEYFCKIVAE